MGLLAQDAKTNMTTNKYSTTLNLDSLYGQSLSQSSSDFFNPALSSTPAYTSSNLGDFSVPRNQTPQQMPAQSFSVLSFTNTFIDPAGLNIPVSDMSAMMCPSTNSTCPTQPMMTFESLNLQNFDHQVEGSPNQLAVR